MNVLGLSCYYHDSAAALVSDGVLVAAMQEERFNREKASASFPVNAVNGCLQLHDITMDQVDHVVFYEKPYLKLERVLISHLRAWPRSRRTFLETMPPWLEDRLVVPLAVKRELGWGGTVHFLPHHVSHAASAFLPSPFQEAAILTADGVGEWTTTSMGVGRGTEIKTLRQLVFPHSLGLLYTAVTTWLGFKALQGEGKVMALADFGEPRFRDVFHRHIEVHQDGSFTINPGFLSVVEGDRMYGDAFIEAFGPPRHPEAPVSDLHHDVAATLQAFLEEVMVLLANRLHEETGLPALCMAGGVCLNISATSKIMEETPFEEIFIQPAAGDSGCALGAAIMGYHLFSKAERGPPMTTAALGPAYGDRRIRRLLEARELTFQELSPEDLAARTAALVAEGKVVGWFQGRMEFGPRALGQRSILADPRQPHMKDMLNAKVKHREPFRPYGVAVLLDHVGDWFHFDRPSPYMLQVAKAREEKARAVPSAVHVNGTSRLQTVTQEENGLYYDMIRAFHEITGVPLVINTSFNDDGEPIVCSPEDAVGCFLRTEIDALAIGPFLVETKPTRD